MRTLVFFYEKNRFSANLGKDSARGSLDPAPPKTAGAVSKGLSHANIGVNPLSLFSSKKTNADSYPDISCENARRPFNPKNVQGGK